MVTTYAASKMRFSHEEKRETLWIVKDVKVYSTIDTLRQKYTERHDLIKSNRNQK